MAFSDLCPLNVIVVPNAAAYTSIVVIGDDKNQLMILMRIAEDLYLFDPLFRDTMCSRISLTFCISEYIS